MIASSLRVLLFGALVTACAHSPSPAEEGLAASGETPASVEVPPNEPGETGAPPPAVMSTETGAAVHPQERCASLTGEQKIKRAAVDAVVAAGLGHWLQGVQIDRVLEGRKFKGWKIGALHLANPCYAAVDLRPGDIVTAVNGNGPKQLERPETAQTIFASLKQAPAIEVNYLRNGQARTLRFEIVDSASLEKAP
jgi:hypothetical protein